MYDEIKEIKELAKRFSPEEISACLSEQMETGSNVCLTKPISEDVINTLSKSEFVRQLMDDKGIGLTDAMRELAKRIRQVHDAAPE